MHYSTKRRVMLGMTTGGLLMTGLGMASAHADTTASGETSHSPGIGSGNLIQLPVNAPINVCGNQLDVIGILDSVTGNSCSNGGGSTTTPTPTPTQPTPPPTNCGCTPPPPPPPTTPCPPSGTTTATPTSSAPGTPSSTSTPSSTGSPTSTSPHGGPNGGSNGNGSSGTPTGLLAHTGSGALVVAPLGAGLIGGGVLLRKRFPSRSH